MNSTPEAAETVKCERCKRTLRSEASIAAGYGPRCAAIKEATRGLSAKQAEEALEMAGDGKAVPSGHKGVWLVPSKEGDKVYMTTPKGQCNCRHGMKTLPGKPCKHVAYVKLSIRPRINPAAIAA